MKNLLRRLRGIIGTGLTWAVGWGAAFGLIQVGVSLAYGFPLSLLGSIVGGATIGFISGGTFATILSIAERHRTLEQLSLKRVALWGGLGGIALFVLLAPRLLGAGLPLEMMMGAFMGPTVLTGLLGAGSAAGSVALARRVDETLIEGEEYPPLIEES